MNAQTYGTMPTAKLCDLMFAEEETILLANTRRREIRAEIAKRATHPATRKKFAWIDWPSFLAEVRADSETQAASDADLDAVLSRLDLGENTQPETPPPTP